ncbi:MAG: InlB B-repeat-containing protein [Lachnospiraceae bacterium]
MKQKLAGFLLIILIAVSVNSMPKVGAAQGCPTNNSADETLKRLYQKGNLYQEIEGLDKTKKEEFWNRITDQEYVVLVILIRCELLQSDIDSQVREKEYQFYIDIVQQLRIRNVKIEKDQLNEIEDQAFIILSQKHLDDCKYHINTYSEYINELRKTMESSAIALFEQMELLYNCEESQYDAEKNKLQSLFELYHTEQEVKLDSGKAALPPKADGTQEPQNPVPSNQVPSNPIIPNPAPSNHALSDSSSRGNVTQDRNVINEQKNSLSKRNKVGYHIEFCSTPCKKEICSGKTYTKDVGTWYETCGVCAKGGRTDNNSFHVTKALDEFYYCVHLGEIHTGCYRYGRCMLYGGSATFDSRIHFYSHVHAYCDGHQKPNTYTVQYRSNGGSGSMADSNHVYDQEKKLNKNTYKKAGYRFIGWGTSPESVLPDYQDEAKVNNIINTEKGVVSLYAIWEETIIVRYWGNGADENDQPMEEIVTPKTAKEYRLKKNEAFTSYTRKNHVFAGWSTEDHTHSYETDYYQMINLPQAISFQELYQCAKNQEITDSEFIVNFYAVWDEMPKLEAIGILEFYEGEVVTRDMLFSNIIASDKENSEVCGTLETRIVRIEYADGKMWCNSPQKGDISTWYIGMRSEERLDTWFLQFRKDYSPVIHKITYELTDSFGNKTSLEWKIKVKYNHPPEIKAEDRYFTLEEAQAGKITKDEILQSINAEDEEDGSLKHKLVIEGFQESEFQAFQHSGYIVLQATVTDQYRKESVRSFYIFIQKDGQVVNEEKVKYVRFINQNNYDKNVNIDISSLTEEEVKQRNKNGGMKVTSIWYTNPAYKKLIMATLHNKKHQETWDFRQEDVLKIKKYVKDGGVIHQQSEKGWQDFISEFGEKRVV